MTREEAIIIAEYRDCISLVERIYDDFESQICENCKWNDTEDMAANVLNYCGHPSDDMDVLTYLPKDFGCNKFERKDSK